MWKRVARLFTIKTRFEAYLVTYAIAVGAVERGRHYLDVYPGALGLFMALLCTGVVFLAGGKLLDAVRPVPAAATLSATHRAQPAARPRRPFSRNRPTSRRRRLAATSARSLRTD